MTWTGGRRQGWISRKPITQRASSPDPAVSPSAVTTPVRPVPVVMPPFPCFSPASVAQLLGTSRQNVHYWLQAGKLEHYRDNLNEPYVLRAELIRFIREYLQKAVLEQGP